MKKLITILLVLMSTVGAAGQTNSLRSEILNYTDTNAVFIRNGRRMLTDKLINGDMEKVRQIKNSLLLAENEKYLTFYPYEMRLLLYYLGEYDELLYTITSLDEKTMEEMRLKVKPGEDDLQERLQNGVRKNREKIEADISQQVENAENRDFLILNLHYLTGGKEYPEITRESLNNDADTFLLKHPDSQYEAFTRENIRYKLVASNWGWGFEFFSGYGLCTGMLHDKFRSNVPFGVDFDIAYKKWTLYLRDYIGIGTVHQDIALNNGVWPNATKANTIVPEASVGYNLTTRTGLCFAPFAGIGGLDFMPTDSQKSDSYYKQVGTADAFTYTVGLNVDIPLGKTSGLNPVVSYNEEGKWFLRIRYGYVMPQFSARYSGFEGNMHYLTIGIGGIGHKIKRDL
jgi:hypothetical protein